MDSDRPDWFLAQLRDVRTEQTEQHQRLRAEMQEGFNRILASIAVTNMESRRDNKEMYVTKDEFNGRFTPIERTVYGLVGLILTGVIITWIALVLRKPV
jgi:hypothetical protein